MSDLDGSKAAVSTPIANENPETLIGTPISPDQSLPTYGVDKATEIEKSDGTTVTLGATVDEVDTLQAKTADLSADGSTYSGAITGDASAAKTDNTELPTVSAVAVQAKVNMDAITVLEAKGADLSADGSKYTGDVSGASGLPTGVTPQTAPAALTAAPTEADFNSLVSLLKSAGVLK